MHFGIPSIVPFSVENAFLPQIKEIETTELPQRSSVAEVDDYGTEG